MGARGTAGPAPLVLLLVLALTVFPSGAPAVGAQEIRDQVLPGCGICYPGGYDINTVGDVHGVIVELQVPADGPVRLVVADERERWVVLASPAWFWESARLRLAPGDTVAVHGSKSLGADGTLYVIAREIRPPDDAPAAVLRDRQGIPLWSGSRRGRQFPGIEADDSSVPGLGRSRSRGAAQ
jgi:hypothetical protein